MKKTTTIGWWAAALTLALAATAWAGQRVRLTLKSGDVITGELVAHTDKTYRVRVGKTERTFAERAVKRVEFLESLVRVHVDADDEELQAVMQRIAKASGTNITIDPSLAKEKISISLRDIPWREAVDVIARMTNCEVERVRGSIYLTRAIKVTLEARDMSLPNVLKTIARNAKRSLVLGPKVRGRVSVSFKAMRWKRALEALAYAAALDVRYEGRVTRINARPNDERVKAPQVRARRLPLQAKAGDRKASVSFKDVELSEAMDILGRQVGRNILVEPSIAAKLTLQQTDAPWTQIVELAARLTKCDVEERAGRIVLLTQPPQNTIRAKKVPADVFFLLAARYAGRDVVVAPEVTASLSCDLSGVYWHEVLASTARTYGYRIVPLPGGAVAVVGPKCDPLAKRLPSQPLDPTKIGSVQLQAVFLPGKNSFERSEAVIGGRICREGKKLRGASGADLPIRLQRIGAASVELRHPAGRTTLKIE